MRIVRIGVQAWTLPLRAPFAIAQRTAYEAQNVLIRIETEEPGINGYGASAPVGYVTEESVVSVCSALEAVAGAFTGQSLERLHPLLIKANAMLDEAPAARAGLEMALYDAWAKQWHLPLWQHFGGAEDVVTTDLTIPFVPAAEAEMLAEAAWNEGFRVFKIKIGDPDGPTADMARLEAIVRVAPRVRLRLDANQAFTPEGAVAFVKALGEREVKIELLEQPVPKEDLEGLKYVKERVGVPVFADEAARNVPEVLRLLREDAIDGINVKLMKSGLTGTLQIIALCRAAGKKLMLGCMLESGLGIAAAAQMAGGTGAFDFLDLDSHRLLAPIAGLTGGFICAGETLRLAPDMTHAAGWGVSLPD